MTSHSTSLPRLPLKYLNQHFYPMTQLLPMCFIPLVPIWNCHVLLLLQEADIIIDF
ncbi:hypothetical protein L873DRAFT_1807420, partial [Choiromyces venosus 120613-1]